MTDMSPLPSSTRKHIRGSSLVFGGRFISIGLKFILQILIVRYLSKSDYGAFAYTINLVQIAAIVSAMSLEKAGSRYISIYDEENDYHSLFGFIVLSLITIFGIGIALVILVVGFSGVIVGTLVNDPIVIGLLIIMISLAPLQAMDSWFQAVFAAFSSVHGIILRRYIIWPVLQLLSVLFVIALQADVYALAWFYLLAGVIGTGMYAVMTYQLLRRRDLFKHFSLPALRFNTREIFGFSIPTMASGLMFILRSHIVVILLGWFGTIEMVAEFRAVLPLATLNAIVYGSFVFLYTPLVARMLSQNNRAEISDLYWRTTAWISIASLPVFLVTFALAQPLVVLLLGERYATSGAILSVLALGQYCYAVMGFNVDTLRVYGVVRYLLLVDSIVMVAAVAAYFILIPMYGAMGGAIGFSFSVALAGILRHIGLAIHTDIRSVNWSYLAIFPLIFVTTVILGLVQYAFEPSLVVTLPLAAVLSLAVLYLTRDKLQVGDIFPELLKMPLVGRLLQA